MILRYFIVTAKSLPGHAPFYRTLTSGRFAPKQCGNSKTALAIEISY